MDFINKRVYKVKSAEVKRESLQKSLKYIFLLSQCFGLLPFRGVLGNDGSNLSFSWRSKRLIVSLLFFLLHLFMASMAIFEMIKKGVNFRGINVSMIYVPGLLIQILFIRLGMRWPSVMKEWAILESSMSHYGYPQGLTNIIRVNIFFVLFATLFEYGFALWSSMDHIFEVIEEGEDALQIMAEMLFSFIFKYLPYSPVLAMFLLAANFTCILIWNLMDLFIIIISSAISERYKQITTRIKTASEWRMGQESFWKSIREDYNDVTNFFRQLESNVSCIVLLSFSVNIYYILVQLFQSLHQKQTGLQSGYFFTSFGLLLLRTLVVSLFASKINEESKSPLQYLTRVPSEMYSVEVERLMMQICHDTIALSGYKLFNVTRGLIFTIAGTIVTYELFLFQFNISMNFYNKFYLTKLSHTNA